mgnify:CR=1 FL=1
MNAPVPSHVLQASAALDHVSHSWDSSILPQLQDYIAMPAKSPAFDAQWAANGWLTNLSDYADTTPGYDEDDFVPSIKTSLSYEDSMYAVPFYGESSFLMYRKDLFDQAGITVPEDPTWQEVAGWAAQFDNPDAKMAGICLRGKPGWGEVLAPLNTVINTFGGRWYDENWNAQLTSPQVEDAVQFYVDTVKEHGQPGPATSGFGECATQFAQGNTAMWYDATSAVSVLEDPASSKVVGNIGYAKAPKVEAVRRRRPGVAGFPALRHCARLRGDLLQNGGHITNSLQFLLAPNLVEGRLGVAIAGEPLQQFVVEDLDVSSIEADAALAFCIVEGQRDGFSPNAQCIGQFAVGDVDGFDRLTLTVGDQPAGDLLPDRVECPAGNVGRHLFHHDPHGQQRNHHHA